MQTLAFTIGTRGSPLAIAQAEETRAALSAVLEVSPEALTIERIRTTGDRITDRPLIEAGGKGLFTKEIDEAMLAGDIDLAVHSAKDLPTVLPDGIVIAACLQREDVRDAFLSPIAEDLDSLPHGAVLGTSSPRRKAMALYLRPDLEVVDLRGNVETRMHKLADGEADATLLAVAGLQRLGLADHARGAIPAEAWLPAVGQGAIAITAREDDDRTRTVLAAIDDPATSIALSAERSCLAVLDGSCRTPIGGWARIDEQETLVFDAIIIKPDGSVSHRAALSGSPEQAETVGAAVGAELVERGGPAFFQVE
ncbi:hydroxymethylbilane synthase [Bauldia sp.]|uniref:hydroxymethylbilane synthase n=1 Tax=Bauldia sp. TaxID=2575872 RepID=UPI003BA97659